MIETPNNPIPLPSDIKVAYDNAKNAVTLAEAEVARLRDLRISEEVTIVELNKQISYTKDQIGLAEATLGYVQNETEVAQNLLTELTEKNATLKAENEAITSDSNIKIAGLITKLQELDKKQEQLTEKEKTFSKNESDLTEREKNISERETKLKEFLKTI